MPVLRCQLARAVSQASRPGRVAHGAAGASAAAVDFPRRAPATHEVTDFIPHSSDGSRAGAPALCRTASMPTHWRRSGYSERRMRRNPQTALHRWNPLPCRRSRRAVSLLQAAAGDRRETTIWWAAGASAGQRAHERPAPRDGRSAVSDVSSGGVVAHRWPPHRAAAWNSVGPWRSLGTTCRGSRWKRPAVASYVLFGQDCCRVEPLGAVVVAGDVARRRMQRAASLGQEPVQQRAGRGGQHRRIVDVARDDIVNLGARVFTVKFVQG